MKHVLPFLLLIILMSTMTSFAQVQKKNKSTTSQGSKKEISLIRTGHSDNNTIGFKKMYKFEYDERDYTLDFLGGNIIEIMKNDQGSMDEMRKFKTKRIVSRVSGIVAPVLFLWGAYDGYANLKAPYAYIAASVALQISNVIFYNLAGRNLENAVTIFNDSPENTTYNSIELKLNPVFGINNNKNVVYPGLGISLNF